MADTSTKISQMPAAVTAGASDVLTGLQGGLNKKFPISVLTQFFSEAVRGPIDAVTRAADNIGRSSAAESLYTGTVNFEQGSVKPSDGSNNATASAKYIRMPYRKVGKFVHLVANSGYHFAVYTYRGTSYGTYIGAYDGISNTGRATVWLNSVYLNLDASIYLRIVLAREDGGDITPTEASNLHYYLATDEKLTVLGAAADAAATGNRFAELASHNSEAVVVYNDNVAETTVNGVTYSIADGVLTISGEATDTTLIVYEGTNHTIPSWITDGMRCFVDINSRSNDGIKLQIAAYDTNRTYVKSFFSSASSGWATFDMTGIGGVIVRLRISKGMVVDDVVSFDVLTTPPNSYINAPGDDATTRPTRLRIMQANVGHFNMGNQPDDPEQYLTPENYGMIFDNYKVLFGEIQPDFIALQEFEPQRTIVGTSPAVTVDITNDIIKPLYPSMYYHIRTDVDSLLAVASKYPLQYKKWVLMHCTAVVGGLEKNLSFQTLVTRLDVDGKNIVIVDTYGFAASSGKFPAGTTNTEKRMARQAQFRTVLDYLDGEDYAFIVCDSNTTGYTVDEDYAIRGSREAHELIENVMKPAGWSAAMGSYFQFAKTYRSAGGNEYSLDNVFYKSGRIILNGFKSEYQRYSELASDHTPVFADFTLI